MTGYLKSWRLNFRYLQKPRLILNALKEITESSYQEKFLLVRPQKPKKSKNLS